MNRIGDHYAMYYDGASAGLINWFGSTSSTRNTYSENRYKNGYDSGYSDGGKIISSLVGDESIKVVTHSMGASYGKGFIRGIIKFANENNINIKNLIEMEVDLAPYQPNEQSAIPGISTTTISHEGDIVAGSKPMKNAKNIKSVFTFKPY